MATLLISTTGGHLAQLVELADRLPPDGDGQRIWVTHDNAQSRSLLSGETAVFVPYIGVKDVGGVIRSVPTAHRLRSEWRPTRVVSTGSGIALGYLPYLAARGVPAHYIESAARVSAPSVSGRLLRSIPGVEVYTQYRHLASHRWRYAGSVFDGFVPRAAPENAVIRRIVVTLGTASEFCFRRLLDRLEPILGSDDLLERDQGAPVETLWQTGGSRTDGLRIRPRPWVPAAELGAAMAAADVVVSHAGAGSALAALRAGRCPVLVPREAARGEIGDDHQEQLARELEDRGLGLLRRVEDLTCDDLRQAAARRVERDGKPPTFELAA
jgi:UDP-N-acetylglucosamine--N-acetylmuramyl-(pentapeptide) pyrophosphoryl-undecaprenol N-acetylglucosamine transferase